MRAWRPPRRIGHGEEATLVEHLEELRQRLFVCLGAVGVGFVIAYIFHTRIIHALELALPPEHRKLVTLTIGEPFMTAMWLSLYAGFLLALPVILWQAWAFFMPAIEPAHERMMRLFVVLSTCCSRSGSPLATTSRCPQRRTSSRTTTAGNTRSSSGARDYIGFAAKVLVAMAIVFELPIFVVGLTRTGIISTDKLRHSRRIGYFVVFVIAVLLPGVDR
jgi:Twin arginine targeting (Tat) protein translocase TatC